MRPSAVNTFRDRFRGRLFYIFKVEDTPEPDFYTIRVAGFAVGEEP